MKITIIQGAFLPVPPVLGGAVEKRWFRLAQEFASLGHEVTHLSRSHSTQPDKGLIGGVQHQRVQGYKQPHSLLAFKFLDLLYSFRVCRQVSLDSDVVVTNTFWSPLLLPRQLRHRAYVDIARTPRGQCRLYRRAGRLRANSTPVAEAILREVGSAASHRVSLIPNPLPFSPPQSVDLAVKQKRILYCGRIHPEKGIELLIHAAAKIPKDWSIDIVGPWETQHGGAGGAYLRSLQELARGLPVSFHEPEFDTQRLADHYRQAAVFAYPSVAEKGETFGLAPLEAMAWGCVPVVSGLACFKDFIHSGTNGIVFDHRRQDAADVLGEELTRLTSNEGFRNELAARACEVGRTHHPTAIAALFLQDFERMLADIKQPHEH